MKIPLASPPINCFLPFSHCLLAVSLVANATHNHIDDWRIERINIVCARFDRIVFAFRRANGMVFLFAGRVASDEETKMNANEINASFDCDARAARIADYLGVSRDLADPAFSVDEIEICFELAAVDSDEIASLPEAE